MFRLPDLHLVPIQLPLLDIAASVLLLLLLMLLRLVAGHAIRRRTEASPLLRRRWSANLRNALLLVGLLGLVLIWAPQLRTLALSLTAVAVAIVIATKELILCFSGSLLRASSGAFAIGDWIELGGTRGEVVDHNLFVTVLHEFQPGTYSPSGRKVVLPNSLLLSQGLRNESLMREHGLHAFTLTLDPGADVFAHRAAIESVVARHQAALQAALAEPSAAIERRLHVDAAGLQPRVAFRTSELGKLRIAITVLCPVGRAEALENDITCELMSLLHGVAQREKQALAGAGA